jgi:xylan 1,4-beta-xylosidase
LSYHKSATASSALENFPVKNAFDENIRTWWSANSGNPGEWLQVDLGKPCRIESLQINFADQGVTNLGRMLEDSYRYTVQLSDDGTQWRTAVDRSDSRRDSPHDYVQLEKPLTARYAKLTNIHMPGGGFFSISGFRLFGNGLGESPALASDVQAIRDPSDPRHAHISWKPAPRADFYIVRHGIGRDKLFNNYQVYNATECDINSLNAGVNYYFTVDAVNDSGIAKGTKEIPVK